MSFAHVQGAHASTALLSTAVSLGTGSAATSGNLIAGVCAYNPASGAGNLLSITSDKGDTATIVDSLSSVWGFASWYFPNCTSGATTWTANFTVSHTFQGGVWDEFSGVATVTPLDGHAQQEQIGAATTTDAVKSGTAVGNAGDLIYGGTFDEAGTNITTGSITHGTGFTVATDDANDVNDNMYTEYLGGSAGASDATFTIATTSSMSTIVMAFKPAASAINVTLVAASASAAAAAFGIEADIGFGGVSGSASVVGLGSVLNFALGSASSSAAAAAFAVTISSNITLVAVAATAAAAAIGIEADVGFGGVSGSASVVGFLSSLQVALGLVSSSAAAGVFTVTATGLLNVVLASVAAIAGVAAFAMISTGLAALFRIRRGAPGHPHRGGGGG